MGASLQIARLGGGLVESYPEETGGRKVSSSFLNNATVSFFERHGFERDRQIGKHHWVVSRRISKAMFLRGRVLVGAWAPDNSTRSG